MNRIERAGKVLAVASAEYIARIALTTGVIDVTKPPYSAPNDGSTDASGRINDALRTSSAVYIPPGIYRTDTPIVVGEAQYLFGAGPSSRILYRGGPGSGGIRAAIMDDDGPRCWQITIRDLAITYDDANGPSLPDPQHGSRAFNPDAIAGVNCGNSSQSLYQGLWITGFSIGVLQGDRLSGRRADAFNVFSSITVDGPGRSDKDPKSWGFHFGGHLGNANGNFLTGCYCDFHERAFDFWTSSANRVRGATARLCHYAVFLTHGSQRNEIDIYIENDSSYISGVMQIGVAAIDANQNLIRYHDDGARSDPFNDGGDHSNVAVLLGTP
jgi:Pectate lyase superfamily protein